MSERTLMSNAGDAESCHTAALTGWAITSPVGICYPVVVADPLALACISANASRSLALTAYQQDSPRQDQWRNVAWPIPAPDSVECIVKWQEHKCAQPRAQNCLCQDSRLAPTSACECLKMNQQRWMMRVQGSDMQRGHSRVVPDRHGRPQRPAVATAGCGQHLFQRQLSRRGGH